MRLTKEQNKRIELLREQAELFDMDIDWETLELVPRPIYTDKELRTIKQREYWRNINDRSDERAGEE